MHISCTQKNKTVHLTFQFTIPGSNTMYKSTLSPQLLGVTPNSGYSANKNSGIIE